MRLRTSFCLPGALLLAFAAVLTAQSTPSASAGPQTQDTSGAVPLFRTNANLVLVDVVVRDKGQPVHDLKASDFRVFEDGRQQKITVFEEHRATDAIAVGKAPADLPPNTFSNAPRYAVTSAANVLLLDALNTPLSDQVYVRRRMLQYLHTIPPGTRIAVFTLASRLRIIEGFTTDRSVIEKALQPGRGNPEQSPVMDSIFDQALSDMVDISAGGGASALSQEAMQQFVGDTKAFEGQLRAEMTIDAMDDIARYLSTVPGRKNLVWFTASMPFNPNVGGRADQDQMIDLRDQAQNMLELLALARVALYPVDARGLMSPPSHMAETNPSNPQLLNSVPRMPAQSLSQQVGMVDQTTFSQNLRKADQSFLDNLAFDHLNMDAFAKETGGKSFYNTNGLGEALGDAIANGADYYTVAYAPDNHNYNGEYRKVEVKLEETGYDIEYRRGYFAYDPSEPSKLIPGRINPLIAAMQHGGLPLSQVLFQVRVLPSTDAALKDVKLSPDPAGSLAKDLKPPLTRYVADFSIDPATLLMNPLPDGKRHTEVELTQVAYDVEGIRQNYTDVGLSVDRMPLSPGQADQPIHLQQEIDLPAGRVYLRIGVRDIVSGRIGTLEIPLTVAQR